MDVEKQFKTAIADIFNVPLSRLKGSTRYVEDLNAKSMDIIAVIAATESKFGIEAPVQEVRQLKTIKQSVDYIKKKMKEKK
jgi:acyl carrier protein